MVWGSRLNFSTAFPDPNADLSDDIRNLVNDVAKAREETRFPVPFILHPPTMGEAAGDDGDTLVAERSPLIGSED